MKKNLTKIVLTLISFIGWSSVTNGQRIAAGGWHSLAVCSDSTVKAFGENATGELGDGSNTDRSTPVSVTGLKSIISVSGGGDQLEAHSLALQSNGTVWAWGSNLYGGLGDGTTTSSNVPVETLLLTDAIAISAGGWHSSALKNDGTVWTWGWNTDGQIGDGTTVDKVLPKKVTGLTGIIAIAAGTYHMLALKNDSTVWAWGDNISGQVGDGSTTDRSTPVKVNGLTGVVKIAAGRFFSLAVKADGTVWTWGENLYGQLGNGNTTNSSVPLQVSGLNGITSAIAANGAFHCMAVKSDNTVWAWGRNTYGNLGDGSTTNSSIPVQMSGVSDIAGMAAGTNFSLLYKTDGTFWGCGRNASGQLGDGTVLQRNTIVRSTSLCPIIQQVGITPIVANNLMEVSAFPNPSASGKFDLKIAGDISQKMKDGTIEIFNVIGETIFQLELDQQTLSTTVLIDLAEQPNGIYFMTLVSGGYSFYQKLIKQ